LAPIATDPYSILGLPGDATAADAEAAMDSLDRTAKGREMQTGDAWDIMRDPKRRLAVDLLRYRLAPAGMEPCAVDAADFDTVIGQLEAEARELANLDFGPPKKVVDLAPLIPGDRQA